MPAVTIHSIRHSTTNDVHVYSKESAGLQCHLPNSPCLIKRHGMHNEELQRGKSLPTAVAQLCKTQCPIAVPPIFSLAFLQLLDDRVGPVCCYLIAACWLCFPRWLHRARPHRILRRAKWTSRWQILLECAYQVLRCKRFRARGKSFAAVRRCPRLPSPLFPTHVASVQSTSTISGLWQFVMGSSTMMFSLQTSKWARRTAMHCKQYNNSTFRIAIDRHSNAMPPTLDEFFNFLLNAPKFHRGYMYASLQSLPPRGNLTSKSVAPWYGVYFQLSAPCAATLNGFPAAVATGPDSTGDTFTALTITVNSRRRKASSSSGDNPAGRTRICVPF
jgi:hypothetical protein